MLPNSPYAVAYHRFDGLSELIRGVEWSILAGDASIGVGRVGGSLVPDTVALAGAPSTPYGTLHGSEAVSVSLWAQGMSELDASVFFGFLDADRNPSNGIRIVAEPSADGVFFPMWVELLNSRTAYRFPMPIPDMDSESDPNPGVPHLVVVQVKRDSSGWRMGFATDGRGISDGGTVDAPRIPGPDIDLPSQIPDDESTFGVLTSGVALDEFAFWSDAPSTRRIHSSNIRALWFEFRSPMDSYTDRFGEDQHDPLKQQRGSLGTPCRVNLPPSIDGPESMLVESGTLAKQNEIELFATDPNGGAVRWSVAAGGSSGTVEIHRHPSRKDAVLVRYAPDGTGSLVAPAELNTCVRDLTPDDYTPGAPIAVTLTCTIDITETSTYIVEDTYPAGWAISNISPGGVDNGTSVRWFFLDSADRVLSYDATPPALESGTKAFGGMIDSDGPAGFQSFPVGGESSSSLLSVSLNTCIRNLTPDNYTPGSPTVVTLTCTIDVGSTSTYIVEDVYPAGWIISNISPGGVDNGISVRWFFLDSADRVLSYDATPPALESGTKAFGGTIDSDGPGGFQSGTVGGETETLDATTTAPATTSPATTSPAATTTLPVATTTPATTLPATTTVPATTTDPPATEDDFVIRAESRCGLFDEAQVRVTIV